MTGKFCAREAITEGNVRTDLGPRAERELAALLRAGLESGKGIPVTKSYWARKRKALGCGRT